MIVKVPLRTCPSPPVPIWLLQLYDEAGLLIVLLVVNYSNSYGLPADGRVHTVGGEVRGGHAWLRCSNRDEEEMTSSGLQEGGLKL